MKTLVLHPQDRSTDFLKPIYANIKRKTVLSKNVSHDKLLAAVRSHDTIIMLGHGSPDGLFNVANIGKGIYTIDYELVEELRAKQLITIWCNADKFIERHRLQALFSGMFISEVSEARYCGVQGDQAMVDESNSAFSVLLGNALVDVPIDFKKTHRTVLSSYASLGLSNTVAKYNSDRFYHNDLSMLVEKTQTSKLLTI